MQSDGEPIDGMGSYIASNKNRFYAAIEADYGKAAVVGQQNRFPASHVEGRQLVEQIRKVEKTGSRTHLGNRSSGRTRTAFQVQSYLSSWNAAAEPGYGSLFQAACGASPITSNGCVVNSVPTATEIVTDVPHGFAVGQAISWEGEIRFVSAVLNAYTFVFNAPFLTQPYSGVLLGPTVTYRLADNLPSFTLFDVWEADSVVSRAVTGCAVDVLEIAINGDYHSFHFSGPASDLVDRMSFQNGQAGLDSFPDEPSLDPDFVSAPVPGHLGQAWFGLPSNQFFTLLAAKVQLKNNLQLRSEEFGMTKPSGIVAGGRDVSVQFSVLAQDDNQTIELYKAARRQTGQSAMLQLGTQPGQLMGIFVPKVVTQIPHYNDGDLRLAWDFQSGVAQGKGNDELFIAFA